jgi:aminopeptidase
VAEGELVQITGEPRDATLLEDLAVAVRRRGAHPLVTLRSDRLARRLFDEVPARYDAQVPEFARKLAGLVDVSLILESEDESALAGVPAARLAAASNATAPVWALLRKRNVRVVWLGNGLYPSATRARQLGLTEPELAALFRAALAVDYAKMSARGAALKKTLSEAKELRLTDADGTDLTMGVAGRPVGVNDGVIGPEKRKQGGAACWAWLPAGEVYLTPAPGTARGKVVIDRCLFEGKEVRGLTLTVRDGKVTSLTAASGGERLRTVYEAAPAGKDVLSSLDVGINPDARGTGKTPPLTFIPAGVVTVGIGNNTWAGGDVAITFTLQGSLPAATLTIDGKPVVERGVLKE